jgi:putative oxidoreductase
MRNVMLLSARLVLGGYLSVHGAQKLFGVLGGHGLDTTGQAFERIGLTPGRPMAALAGATELAGGLLTATGAADPAGPLAIIGAMAVASATHRANGPLAASGGFELPVTNLAAAAALAAAGPGRLSLGRPLPRPLTAAAFAVGGLLAAVSLAKLRTAQQRSAAGQRVPSVPAPDEPGVPAEAGDSSAGAEA